MNSFTVAFKDFDVGLIDKYEAVLNQFVSLLAKYSFYSDKYFDGLVRMHSEETETLKFAAQSPISLGYKAYYSNVVFGYKAGEDFIGMVMPVEGMCIAFISGDEIEENYPEMAKIIGKPLVDVISFYALLSQSKGKVQTAVKDYIEGSIVSKFTDVKVPVLCKEVSAFLKRVDEVSKVSLAFGVLLKDILRTGVVVQSDNLAVPVLKSPVRREDVQAVLESNDPRKWYVMEKTGVKATELLSEEALSYIYSRLLTNENSVDTIPERDLFTRCMRFKYDASVLASEFIQRYINTESAAQMFEGVDKMLAGKSKKTAEMIRGQVDDVTYGPSLNLASNFFVQTEVMDKQSSAMQNEVEPAQSKKGVAVDDPVLTTSDGVKSVEAIRKDLHIDYKSLIKTVRQLHRLYTDTFSKALMMREEGEASE